MRSFKAPLLVAVFIFTVYACTPGKPLNPHKVGEKFCIKNTEIQVKISQVTASPNWMYVAEVENSGEHVLMKEESLTSCKSSKKEEKEERSGGPTLVAQN